MVTKNALILIKKELKVSWKYFIPIALQEFPTKKKGKAKTVKVTFTNDEKEMDYKEVRIVAFIQDAKTHEVLGTTVTKEHPFK